MAAANRPAKPEPTTSGLLTLHLLHLDDPADEQAQSVGVQRLPGPQPLFGPSLECGRVNCFRDSHLLEVTFCQVSSKSQSR